MSGTKAGALKRRQTQPGPSATQEGRAESRPDQPVYVVPPKRSLLHQGKLLQAGEVVEGAHLWPRVETWVATGRIALKET